ncbi:MAG: glycosyltransferase [candidate division Zixibacteria bacterium]|nr:glycosyltransferase [candidate division Zixibacteria bacterium]
MSKIMYIAFAQSSHTIKWVKYFRDLGNDIMLVSFYPGNSIDGVDIRYLRCTNKNLAILKLPQVKKLIRYFKPDILHAHYASSCGIVAALTGFHPYVLSVWGDDILEFPQKSLIHRWLVKKAINKADYATATSNMLANATKDLINDNKNIKVIPFGVDISHYKFTVKSPDNITHIGTVRNLLPKYGLAYLIKAFASLIKKYDNLKLTIVGDGYLRSSLELLVNELGINNHVIFTGFVAHEKVVGYLKTFDIFIMPSIGEGETFGVAAVEAMAIGLPVVASKIGGLPEVIDDGQTGILVKPGDVEDLKKALEYYIINTDVRIKHGRAGRKKVEEKYNWQDNAEMMNRLYLKILNEKD